MVVERDASTFRGDAVSSGSKVFNDPVVSILRRRDDRVNQQGSCPRSIPRPLKLQVSDQTKVSNKKQAAKRKVKASKKKQETKKASSRLKEKIYSKYCR
jgi:hypothetical protein